MSVTAPQNRCSHRETADQSPGNHRTTVEQSPDHRWTMAEHWTDHCCNIAGKSRSSRAVKALLVHRAVFPTGVPLPAARATSAQQMLTTKPGIRQLPNATLLPGITVPGSTIIHTQRLYAVGCCFPYLITSLVVGANQHGRPRGVGGHRLLSASFPPPGHSCFSQSTWRPSFCRAVSHLVFGEEISKSLCGGVKRRGTDTMVHVRIVRESSAGEQPAAWTPAGCNK